MNEREKELKRLQGLFDDCRKVLFAISEEVRYRIIGIILEGPCEGSRVADIAKKTELSRPAVSHHVQILKDAGILKSRKEGTLIYYYLDPDAGELQRAADFFSGVNAFMKDVPDRSGK